MMSNQWKYIVGILFLFLLACNRAGEHEALFRQVESVMNKRPDSALVLLESIQNPERLPERDWAYWALLTTQAKDKLYIRHTSDSVINRVVDYFDGFIFFRYRHEKALAYFYKGRVHEDLGDVKKALEAYLKASDFVKGTGDYKLTYLIESYLGDIYVHQGANDLALKYFNKAKEAAERSKDSLNIAYTLVYLARGHGKQENWTQASDFYKQAIKIARQSQNIDVVLIGMQELASVYARQDSLISALNLMKHTVELEIKYDITHDFSTDLVIGNIYRKLCQVDSALFYLEKALGSENIYTRRSTYQALYYLYIEADSLSKAIKYNELVNASADSIAKKGSPSDLYQVKEAHEAVNRQAVDTRRWLLAGAIVLALLFALGYFYYRYRTNRRRLERQVRDYEERSARQESEASRSAFVNSPLYSRFHDKHEIWTPTAEDWEALFGGVDSAYPGFSVALGESLPHLSLVERRLCYLVKIGVKPGVIARLLCCSDSAVSMYRKRLYEKATGQSGSAKDFDRYISEL